EGSDLRAQLDECGLTLGLDLCVGKSRHTCCLSSRSLFRLGDDLLAVLTGGLTDLAGFGTRLSKLTRVLLESRLRFLLSFVCLRDVAFDGRGARVEHRRQSG